jgi:hypothetical protein
MGTDPGPFELDEPRPQKEPTTPAPRSAPARGRRERPRKKGLGALGIFLFFGIAPAAAAVWFFLQPEDERQRLLDKVPEGAGGRAIKAGICLAILFGLAKIALPAFYGAAGTLKDGMNWIRGRKGALRVALWPAEFLLWFGWFALQILLAVDMVMVVAACLATLLLVARILEPDLFPDLFPDLLT